MKRFNKNCLVFIIAAVFIALGFGNDYRSSIVGEIDGFAKTARHNFSGSFISFKDKVEDISDKKIRYHNILMDINSVRENVLGTRIIIKPDTTVVKADSGSLIIPAKELNEDEINNVVAHIAELNSFVEDSGSKFLYCAAPVKSMYEKGPANISNYSSENMDTFLVGLQDADVPALDLRATLDNSSIEPKDLFYYTDHHWTVRSGLAATKGICESLNDLYGFDYNAEYADVQNYKVTVLKDWFLGAYGKKVGRFFAQQGADDFEVIIPAFKTDMTEENPLDNNVRIGSFEDTVMFQDKLEKNYYGKNTYAAYSCADFHLQIMKNNTLLNGKRVLMIRDSFGCVVAPFLALQTQELYVCDMRRGDYVSGQRLALRDFITETNPDYVIVLFAGVGTVEGSDGKYNFFD